MKTKNKFSIISINLLLLSALSINNIYAQTVIHETNAAATPDAKSALDVQSTTKGVLFPNLSTSQMTSLPSPTISLLIYCRTDGNFYYYNGTTWRQITRGASVLATNPGGSGTDVGVGIGLDDPDNSALLHVNANNKGVLLPRMTTAQVTAIAAGAGQAGMLVYDATLNKVQYYNGAAWTSVTDVAAAAANVSVGTAAGVIVGTGTVDASAKLEIKSTAGGFLIPRMTTVQRDAIPTPADGLMIYNSTVNKVQYYVAPNWYPW